MNILISSIGRFRSGPEKLLFDQYVARLPSWQITLKEYEVKKSLSGEALQQEEMRLLLQHVPAGAVTIALDENGKSFSSPDFAARLEKFRQEGRSSFAFFIGGADGHHPALRKQATLCLSLGAMTWPHMLVRSLLAEQLYRAHTILTGHPYHRN